MRSTDSRRAHARLNSFVYVIKWVIEMALLSTSLFLREISQNVHDTIIEQTVSILLFALAKTIKMSMP